MVDLLCFFFLKNFCPDISKNLNFFLAGETTPAHHGGQAVRSPEFAAETPNPFANRQPRHSAVSDRGYSRRSGRGQSQRQCCDCPQQENDGETEGIIARAQVGDDGASEEQDETDCEGRLIVPISGGFPVMPHNM